MLKELMDALKKGPKAPKPSTIKGNIPQIAAAALLVEAARKDRNFTQEERETVKTTLLSHYHLGDGEAEALLEEAEKQQSRTYEDWSFTQLVKQGFSEAEREEVLEMLWEVAFADAPVHKLENRMIERVGSDLGIADDRIEALRAAVAKAKGFKG